MMLGSVAVASHMNEWEQKYQNGDTHWDRGAPSPALVEWFEKPAAGVVGAAVVIGCGTGHDVAFLHRRGIDVCGLDIAPTALAKAKTNYPEVPAERWIQADLFDLPAEVVGRFDVLIEHTCLSGLPPDLRAAYRQAVLKLLKPGALIVGVWFINPDMEPDEVGPPFALPIAELDALFAEDAEILEDYTPSAAYPGREGRERVRVYRLK